MQQELSPFFLAPLNATECLDVLTAALRSASCISLPIPVFYTIISLHMSLRSFACQKCASVSVTPNRTLLFFFLRSLSLCLYVSSTLVLFCPSLCASFASSLINAMTFFLTHETAFWHHQVESFPSPNCTHYPLSNVAINFWFRERKMRADAYAAGVPADYRAALGK